MGMLSNSLGSKIKDNLTVKNVATAAIGGALLIYAFKNRSSRLGKLASAAGSSLIGRTLDRSGII